FDHSVGVEKKNAAPPERLEVPQSKSERHNEALRQAREKLGLNPGQTPTDFPGLSKLMKTADDIERGMRAPEKKPVTPQVPAMAGMTPLGAKPEVKANVEPKPEVVPVTAEGNQSWREAANVIQRQILTMPVDEARPALAHATETIQAANDPDLSPQEKRAMLDVAERHRVALDKEAELKVIAAKAGRQHFDVKGWLAEDFGDSGFGHVMAGDVLTKVALGDGYLDPAYNVDAQGIFVNPGPGQAARIRLQQKAGMAPLVFSRDALAAQGIEVQRGAEGVINQRVPLTALTKAAKDRAIDVILNELEHAKREISDHIVAKIATNLGVPQSAVRARIAPKAVTAEGVRTVPEAAKTGSGIKVEKPASAEIKTEAAAKETNNETDKGSLPIRPEEPGPTQSVTGARAEQSTTEQPNTENDPLKKDWDRANAYKPPKGGALSVKPVPAS